ncbi:dihydrolipoamide acetyltransferase family protein [Thiohalomonas denitrificans]|uniref:dihydrolipoamide acetyltransferase family protein n=1 Tax=Thiohalomonas denitrificans TaxID=415747 RepID=UPI0026ED56E1|nr:dihydrolipoamide acetyltransferase family protein [Thiohalomonas denitrificans]
MAEYRMQDPGEGIHEAEILDLKVASGDRVNEGDTLFAVETDKAVQDVPSPFTGQVTDVRINRGDMVRVGDVLLTYEAEGEEAKGEKAKAEKAKAEKAKDEEVHAKPPMKGEAKERHRPSQPERPERSGTPVPASPATRRRARELGVDLRQVEPSGPHERVTDEDVQRVAQKPEREFTPEAPPAVRPAELPDFSRWGAVERQPLHGIRRATARQMERARSIPQVTHQDLADITALESFRREHADSVKARGGKLTMTVIVMKATAAVLRRFPRFNASLDAENEAIILKHYCHIGMAVATKQGLLVPVVRDVDRKSLIELAIETIALAEKARAGKMEMNELQGASFSLTNPGGIGGTWFTPLINPPEAAILGMTRADWRPVLEGDPERGRFRARLMLPLSLTFDHRLNDGADAAYFVRSVAEMLADPESLLLSI